MVEYNSNVVHCFIQHNFYKYKITVCYRNVIKQQRPMQRINTCCRLASNKQMYRTSQSVITTCKQSILTFS